MTKTMPIILLALAGCAQTDAARTAFVDQVASVSDDARLNAELVLCRGITVGAWIRAYGQDADRAAAWKTLCTQPIVEQTPAKGATP